MKKVYTLFFMLFMGYVQVGHAVNLYVSGTISTVRQDNFNDFVRVSLEGATVDVSGCSNKNFALVFLTSTPDFDRQYAAVLLAKATDAEVVLQYDPDVCAPTTVGGATFAVASGIIVE